MYKEAMEVRAKYMQSSGGYSDEILQEQADWLENNKKYKEAGSLYIAIGKKKKAIEIYGEHNYLDSLIEICRDLSKETEAELIKLCGNYFKKNHNYQYAQEAFLKLDDRKSLVNMNVDLKKWEEAFALSRGVKSLNEYVHLKYAESLILEDKFKEAQESYRQAGRVDLSIKLLSTLIDNSVYEKRFKDACFFFISYASDALSLIKDCQQNVEKLSKAEYSKVKEFKDSNDLADCFNAYDYVYKYIEEPFNSDIISMSEQSLFNACVFLVNKISSMNSFLSQSKDISPAYIFHCLGILAKKFEAFKTAQFCFQKLANLQYPVDWTEKIDKEIMDIRNKPCLDGGNIIPECPYCNHSNGLINTNGDYCSYCFAPFIRCGLSFEILPLVEFRQEKKIPADTAIDLIKQGTVEKMKNNILSKNKDGVKSL
jgi:intraflagellar transport protein 122